jgi:hypothetical protein
VNVRGIIWLILPLALPAVSVAQDARMERIRQAFPAEAARIESIISDAEAAGLPGGPLVDKALEGAAKRIPGNLVVAALSNYAGRLNESIQLIGRDRVAAEVVAGADALRRGVPGQTVRTMAQQHRGDIAVPLVVMGDLVESGVPPNDAYQLVNSAMERKHTPDELLAIPGAVRGLMRQGNSPADAAGSIGSMIRSGQRSFMGPQGRAMAQPPKGAPVPPGSGPPDHSGGDKRKGGGKGNPPGGGSD